MRRIAVGGFVYGEIGSDDHGLAAEQPLVQQTIQRSGDKLAGHLRAKIVNDQKIAFFQAFSLGKGLFIGCKTRFLQFVNKLIAVS